MLIAIFFYPATFSFETKEKLPPFKYECKRRQELLLFQLYLQRINSPWHTYEDYKITHVIKTNKGEIWGINRNDRQGNSENSE
jgi:hypothetical protein